MRTLDQAGLSAAPFARVADVAGVPLALTYAVARAGRYGPEVVFSFRLLADAFDPNGNAIPLLFRCSLSETEGRLAAVRAFEQDSEEIGPVYWHQLPAIRDGEDGAWVLNDASHMLTLDAAPAPAQLATAASPKAPARNGAGAAASRSQGRSGRVGSAPADDQLEDLPF